MALAEACRRSGCGRMNDLLLYGIFVHRPEAIRACKGGCVGVTATHAMFQLTQVAVPWQVFASILER
jgi:hypothetical protein